MSLRDGVVVGAQNIVSNGFGASVGLEAAYTQAGSGVASRLGQVSGLRRGDLRVLVGCGAAGAIAAAFGAPLTGAFYAFELVIGTYAIAGLAPVMASAVAGTLVARALGGVEPLAEPGGVGAPDWGDYGLALLLGLLCGLVGHRPDARHVAGRGGGAAAGALGVAAAGGGRARGRRAGIGDAGRALGRARRPAPGALHRHRRADAAASAGAEGRRGGGLDRQRLPRRAVLRLAAPGGAAGQAVRARCRAAAAGRGGHRCCSPSSA